MVQIINFIKRCITIPLKHIFHSKCKECNRGYIIMNRIEYIGSTEIIVYKCNHCHKEYI